MADRATTALDGVGLTLSAIAPRLRRAGAALAKAGAAARRYARPRSRPEAGVRAPTSPETAPDVHGDPETPV
jgi:hypothetical protein